MARKRKNTKDGENRSPKRTKRAADDGDDGDDEDDEDDAFNEDDAVNWVIPKAKRKQTADSTHINMYAQRLYARNPTTLRSMQNPLQEAQIRTPVFKRHSNKAMVPSDPNRPSAALCNLFNEIKMASLDESDGRYQFASLAQQLQPGDDDTALVLSRAEGNRILVINDDRRLQV
jgi:hypothetical protein